MHILIVVLGCLAIAGLAFFAGFMTSTMVRKKRSNSGVIKIIPDEGKLIYSLELHDNPVMLQHMDEVVFKVESSDESS